ncbi:DUF4870 family protein [Parvibaculum sp.]|uniref:DUF4870 family protein n=1 Tax=Parvibaculum sp. TaxID=2024848 RepID=UPI003BAB2CAB
MTETQPPATQPGATNEMDGPKLVYILYFISLAVGITAIAGLIVAYLKRGEASAGAATHYTFLIRTFWIGLLFAVISGITSIIGIGVLLAIATVVWFLIRTIKGFMLAIDGKPVPEPETWLW